MRERFTLGGVLRLGGIVVGDHFSLCSYLSFGWEAQVCVGKIKFYIILSYLVIPSFRSFLYFFFPRLWEKIPHFSSFFFPRPYLGKSAPEFLPTSEKHG